MSSRRALIAISVLILGAFAFGISAGTYKHFPHPQIAAAIDALAGEAEENTDLLVNRVRPGRVQRSETHFATFAPEVDVVMVGDSITDEGIWNEIFPGVSIANRGIWGDTTADVLHRLDTITALRARKAFILLGVNDILSGRDIDAILADYDRIASALGTDGTEVHVQSVMECAAPLCREKIGEIRALNSALREYAAANALVYIDLNPAMADPETGLYPNFTNDGVHLLGAGYGAWADLIAGYVGPQSR